MSEKQSKIKFNYVKVQASWTVCFLLKIIDTYPQKRRLNIHNSQLFLRQASTTLWTSSLYLNSHLLRIPITITPVPITFSESPSVYTQTHFRPELQPVQLQGWFWVSTMWTFPFVTSCTLHGASIIFVSQIPSSFFPLTFSFLFFSPQGAWYMGS